MPLNKCIVSLLLNRSRLANHSTRNSSHRGRAIANRAKTATMSNKTTTLLLKNMLPFLIIVTSIKILCMPAYRSTDFDVHRNWKALTRHLPLEEWYFDDVNGTTVHTLDYPPVFAYFESFWSNNIITSYLLGNAVLDERCLALLPDSDNGVDMPCVVFMRTTVILSDFLLWWGAWVASTSMTENVSAQTTTFLLIVLNPGLLWLDHVHFQYNGMLLGILLASLGYLLKPTTTYNVGVAAVLYTLLISMKHLYISLGPIYLVYLLRHYCFTNDNKFQIPRFIYLGVLTISTLLLCFLPFLNGHQSQQMLARLFPFGRGLCHDYPAANVWSLYMVADKVVNALLAKSLPEVTPLATAVLLLLSMLPGLYAVGSTNKKSSLVMAVVYCSLCAFIFMFHVHEKAILTTIIPLSLLATYNLSCARLYIRTSALGLFGLFPLLFRVQELPLKVFAYIAYMSMIVHVLSENFNGKLLLTTVDYIGMIGIVAVSFFLEVFHPLFLYPWMEALPLLITSIACASGLMLCWIQSWRLMMKETSAKSVSNNTQSLK